LVGFNHEVGAEVNEKFPSMSRAKLLVNAFAEVEMFKKLSYEAAIMSPRLKSVERRGKWIVERIFESLLTTFSHHFPYLLACRWNKQELQKRVLVLTADIGYDLKSVGSRPSPPR
jgi:dGTP triphosphohydrolase